MAIFLPLDLFDAAIVKCDGKDIVKRSSTRKSRYLLVFNCHITPAAAGRLGTLTHLDTPNPVMYIEFPEGRLKLLGTLVFPHNKYLILRLGNKEVLCEDVLESFIVFSEAQWVGDPIDNPSEKSCPIPLSLLDHRRHEIPCDLDLKSSTEGPHPPKKEGSKESAAALDTMGRGSNKIEKVDEHELGNTRVEGGLRLRRTSRNAGRKRKLYAEDSDGIIAGDENDSDEQSGSSF